MKIITEKNGTELILKPEGRLDVTTAPELAEIVNTSLEGVTDLTFDLAGLEYISSVGLRVLLSAHKKMAQQGSMKITGAGEIVMEVFEITGFRDILTIE